MTNPHILVLPYPAQGHVKPLMLLAHSLAKYGFRITFVSTEVTHKCVLNVLEGKDILGGQIHLVSIPDGAETWEDRNVPGKLTEAMCRVMPGKLEELIRKINESDGVDKVIGIIADQSFGWALEVGKKIGIKLAAFLPAAAAQLVLGFSIPKLIDDRIIDNNGTPTKKQTIQLSPSMPPMSTENFVWACFPSLEMQKIIFDLMVRNNKAVALADWLICNSTYNLEPGAFSLAPEILPIGPILASDQLGNSTGNFWPEDSTCLKWLDQQPPNSVIYVAFGSFTIFNQTQFQELALGLELTNRPFLWVVRPDITDGTKDSYPDGFSGRVTTRGKMVGWAPQQGVLSHPSVACFLSHCGWNSTMEGVSNGVPILCWPYFADQFLNQSYICDVWKVGLRFEKDERRIITREEIKKKVEQLLSQTIFKARAMELKEVTLSSIKEGGYSCKNFKNFIEWMKV
ncbi:Trans-zeatin O-beta-D-glucosyltransferase [Bertholletia excelsa]